MGTATWGNSTSGDWISSPQWTGDGNTIPGYTSSDDPTVIINTAVTVKLAANETINNVQNVQIGGNGVTTTLDISGAFGSTNGTGVQGITLLSKGVLIVETGGSIYDTNALSVNAGATTTIKGTVTASSGYVVNGAMVISGGTVSTSSNLSGAGTITLQNGATLNLTAQAPSFTGVYAFGGNQTSTPNTLDIAAFGYGSTNYKITNFGPGDRLQAGNIPVMTASFTQTGGSLSTGLVGYVTINGYAQIAMTLAPGVTASQVSASGNDAVACFVEGSLIATPQGEVAVERLAVGDLVHVVHQGAVVARAVKWVGWRHVKAGELPADEAHPVRIKAGAFADGVPARDLLLTAEHCIVVAGCLTPVRLLVNGRSIFVDVSVCDFTYYHVELEAHGILLAQGLAVESYLYSGNRAMFANAAVTALRPQLGVGVVPTNPARPVLDLLVAAHMLKPHWEALNERACVLGLGLVIAPPELSMAPDLHIVTDTGAMLYPGPGQGEGRVVFEVPAGAQSFWLVSRTGRPCDVVAPYIDDRRALGVLVGEMSVKLGPKVSVVATHLEDVALAGWHGMEPQAPGRRWTAGRAALRLEGLTQGQGAVLEIQILQAGPYLSQSPQQREAA